MLASTYHYTVVNIGGERRNEMNQKERIPDRIKRINRILRITVMYLHHSRTKVSTSTICFFIIVSYTLFAPDIAMTKDILRGEVITQHDPLNIRSGPGKHYPVIGNAKPGETLVILDNSGEWYHLRLQNGREGYGFYKYIRFLSDVEVNPAFLLSKHKAGFIEVRMTVDALYQKYDRQSIRLVDLYLEGTFSPALEIYLDNGKREKPSLVAEIGWEKNWVIRRINVYDQTFKLKSHIGVGSTLGDLRKFYSIDWIGSGEGSVYARVEEVGMSFALESTNIPEKWYTTNDLTLLPGDVKIVSILIN
jgi:hypothetical protein